MRSRKHMEPAPKRSLRVGLAARHAASADKGRRSGAERTRRGSHTALNAAWRRCEMGTNQIACFGVWRRGTRRQAERRNRSGITRWHMPHQGGAHLVLPGARHDVVNQD
ncbi:MAG: hypothetical protein WDN01_07170 [Rhizomicrobium sp.]